MDTIGVSKYICVRSAFHSPNLRATTDALPPAEPWFGTPSLQPSAPRRHMYLESTRTRRCPVFHAPNGRLPPRPLRPPSRPSTLEESDQPIGGDYYTCRLCGNEEESYDQFWSRCPTFDADRQRLDLGASLDELIRLQVKAQALLRIILRIFRQAKQQQHQQQQLPSLCWIGSGPWSCVFGTNWKLEHRQTPQNKSYTIVGITRRRYHCSEGYLSPWRRAEKIAF